MRRQQTAGGVPVRVLLVDDHAILRRGLASVLANEPDIEIAGEADDGADAVALADELRPDVVLMDVWMPGTDGIDACEAIMRSAPSTKVVMLTISDSEDDLFAALKAGATGYLLKTVPVDELAAAVRAVVGGESFINPSMATKLITEFAVLAAKGPTVPVHDDEERPPELTAREVEVLRLVARGLSNREIAAELGISDNTVKNHVRNILEKLRLHTRMEAAMYAMKRNLVPPE